MPGKTIKKAIKNYKSKKRVKKLLKSGNPEEKYDTQGNIIFKNGGKTRKAKRAGKKVIRKIKKGKDVASQSSKNIMANVVSRTQDPVKSGSAGSGKVTKTKSFTEKVKNYVGYSKGGLIQYD